MYLFMHLRSHWRSLFVLCAGLLSFFYLFRACAPGASSYRPNPNRNSHKSLVISGSTPTISSAGLSTTRDADGHPSGLRRKDSSGTTTKPVYVPPEGHIEITPRRDIRLRDGQEVLLEDLVSIKYKTWGLIFRPGLAVSALPLAFGLDAKLLFWNKVGLNAGLLGGKMSTASGSIWISPTATFSYRLDTKLTKNTELFAGYLPLSPLIVPITGGVRINL